MWQFINGWLHHICFLMVLFTICIYNEWWMMNVHECTVQIVKECHFVLIHPQSNHPFHQVKDLWQLWHQGRRSRWRAPCSQSGTSQQQQSMGRFWKPYPNDVVYGIIFSCFAGSPSLKPSAQWRGVLLNLSSMPGASRISLKREFWGMTSCFVHVYIEWLCGAVI